MRFELKKFPYGTKILAALGGSAAAQAINILGALVIARIYAPAQFGIFASWLGVTHILTICLSHMLEHAFGLEPDGDKRSALVVATVAVALITSMAAGVIVAMAYLILLNFFDYDIINHTPPILWWLLVPQSLGAALSLIWQSWAANNGNLRYLAHIRISQATFIVVLQILAGIMRADVVSLVVAQTVGGLLSLVVCGYLMPLQKPSQRRRLLQDARFYWRKYRQFPLMALPASLIGTAANRLPILLLAGKFGAEVAGYYALVARVMATPIALLGGAVLDVFKRSAAAERNATGRCALLLALSAIVAIAVWVFAYDFFLLVFGAQWAVSGSMAVWLLPMTATAFVASPLSYMFFIMQKQGVNLGWQICLCGMTILTFMVFDSYQKSIVIYSFGYAILNIICILLSYVYSRTGHTELS